MSLQVFYVCVGSVYSLFEDNSPVGVIPCVWCLTRTDGHCVSKEIRRMDPQTETVNRVTAGRRYKPV